MRRLAVFVFYDAYGIADQYIKYLLSSIRKEVQELVVIVNGIATRSSEQMLKMYADFLFYRKNIGYDGGAYKDFFSGKLGYDKWEQFDEIILFNDTFFGPIYPWKDCFTLFQNESVDFWGLSSHPAGIVGDGIHIQEHVQAFFLVVKKSIICSPFFSLFWEELDYSDSYLNAVLQFEVRFSTFFREKGFIGKSILDLKQYPYQYNRNPYLYDSSELIEKYSVPILKIKCFNILFFCSAPKALDYIKESRLYPVEYIREHIERLCREDSMRPFNHIKLMEFCREHTKVYIYGNGRYAKNISCFLRYMNVKVSGMIVSDFIDIETDADNVYHWKDVNLEGNVGIVLGVSKKFLEPILLTVREVLHSNQLFIPKE